MELDCSRAPAACVSSRPLLFALNGRRVEVASPDPSMTLLSFLRSHAGLTGTKLSCGEGGCGACLVLLATYNPISKQVRESSINSCLALLCSLDGCSITTIEGLGSTHTGFHAIQQRMAGFDASQCGYCTPGMCISLYSSLRNSTNSSTSPSIDSNGSTHSCVGNGSNEGPACSLHTIPTLSCDDAQKAIVGNICRCTGYRPILDACKSFAGDVDVEDLGINSFWASAKEANTELLPPYSRSADSAFPELLMKDLDHRHSTVDVDAGDQHRNGYLSPIHGVNLNVRFRDSGAQGEEKFWIQAHSLDSVFEALHSFQGRSDVKLVVGNTSSGYYKDQSPCVLVDVGRVPELLVIKNFSGLLSVGAAVTIEKLIDTLEARPCTGDGEMVAFGIASHLRKVANPHVRHRASVGGNLIMAQQFQFDSDLATLFLAVGATLRIIAADRKTSTLSMEDFFQRGLLEPGWILESITLPLYSVGKDASANMSDGNLTGIHHTKEHEGLSSNQYYFKSYRASPRSLGNALAHLNAAFLASISSSDACSTVLDLKLAFGAFGGAHAMRAHRVESFLSKKSLNSNVFVEAISILKDELKPSLEAAKQASYKMSLAVDYLSDFLCPLLAASNGVLSLPAPNGNAVGPVKSGNNTQMNGVGVGRMHISGKQTLPDVQEDFLIHKAMEKTEAKIQAAGEAVYVDDVPCPDHCLFAAFVLSTKAAANIKQIDPKQALACPGAVAFIAASDIPEGGANVGSVAFTVPDDLFADKFVEFVGHPLGILVADSPEHAKAAALRVKVEYEVESSPILCIEDAVAKNSKFSIPPFASKASTGNVEQGFSEAEYQISDAEVKTGSQYYFYMENQTAMAIPDEDNCMVVYSSCQSPDHLQKSVSMCLGLPYHNVRVITRRVGGGFGGKATRNIVVASACSLAAYKLRRPVRMYLDRKTDMTIMGGRHPTKTVYSVAFKSDGKVTGLKAKVFIDGGWSEDTSPFMPLLVASGMRKYDWGSMAIDFVVCKTNLSSKSAMRGPGHLQGSFIADTILEHVAATLRLDVHTVITRNMHSLESASLFFPKVDMTGGTEGYTLPSMWNRMLTHIEEERKVVVDFNATNMWLKRGLSVLPCVYEVNQSPKPAKVSIFQDGSVVVEVGGIELGQGLWTKVKQATVHGLSQLITPKTGAASMKVRVVQADSISLPHGGFTAGSTASEGSCEAVRQACQVLVERLLPLKVEKEEKLSKSLCIGFFLTEELEVDDKGELVTTGTWTYKPPTIDNIPRKFAVELWNSAGHGNRILSSKASGEPPLVLAGSVHSAVRRAIEAAREGQHRTSSQGEDKERFFRFDTPATMERVKNLCGLQRMEEYLRTQTAIKA